MPLPSYYTTSDLAASFGVTPRTLKRWSNQKETPFEQPMPQPIRCVRGSENKYNAELIDLWIKENYDKSHLVA